MMRVGALIAAEPVEGVMALAGPSRGGEPGRVGQFGGEEFLDRLWMLAEVFRGETEQRQLVQDVGSCTAGRKLDPVLDECAEPGVGSAPGVAEHEALDRSGLGERPLLTDGSAHR